MFVYNDSCKFSLVWSVSSAMWKNRANLLCPNRNEAKWPIVDLKLALRIAPSAVEIDRYLGFVDILGSAKIADFIGLSRCWQNAVILHIHADNLPKKAQQSKSRQLSCSNASRCVSINKHTRWITAETKASSLIRLIKNHSKILKLLQFEIFNS